MNSTLVHSYSYNQLGNITSLNGNDYTYGSKSHAVTYVGSTTYQYDNNGNMMPGARTPPPGTSKTGFRRIMMAVPPRPTSTTAMVSGAGERWVG